MCVSHVYSEFKRERLERLRRYTGNSRSNANSNLFYAYMKAVSDVNCPFVYNIILALSFHALVNHIILTGQDQ